MSKSTKIIAALGVVAGIGVAALPLTSYAATEDVTVSVTVDSSISLAVAGSTGTNTSATMLPNAVDLTSLKAVSTVSTNNLNGYTLTVVDADTNTSLVSGTNSIPAQSGAPVAGTAGWAVKASAAYDGQTAGLTNWTAMPAAGGTALVIRNKGASTAITTNEASDLEIGVATDAAQATGVYTDVITFTAVAN